MITALDFKNAVISGANNITARKKAINDLNVFPVPDGDTGTNMSMTISASARMLEEMEITKDTDIDDVAYAVADTLLRNARGNSGVILSLIFRGFAQGCKGKKYLDTISFASALRMGAEASYKAVLKPVEGTILTVCRMTAEGAKEAASEGGDMKKVIDHAFEHGKKALKETTEMLPLLKKAGVVDAGGEGFMAIFEGMRSYLNYGKIIAAEVSEASTEDEVADPVVLSEDEITFTYCTEFIILKDDASLSCADELKEFLNSIGDSIVVVEADEIVKVHVHTDDPGKALQKALTYGMTDRMKIENMRLQFRARQKSEGKKSAKKEEENIIAEPDEKFGIVAVAAGEGLTEIFKELGCHSVIEGGQTMNPSTENIMKACLATPAKNVFVLPNNKNIVMAAQQASSLVTDRKIYVVPTKTIPQGIMAAMNFDESLSPKKLLSVMTEAAENVYTGQITCAARDSDFDGSAIKKGQILALKEDKLAFAEDDLNPASLRLVKELSGDEPQFISVFYGSDVDEETAQKLSDSIEEAYPDAEINLICGGQPVYHYIFSVEC